jgi:hypothetical protein
MRAYPACNGRHRVCFGDDAPGIFKRSPFGQDLEIVTYIRPCRTVVLAGRLLKGRGLFSRDHLQGLTWALLDANTATDALVLINLDTEWPGYNRWVV